jgi:hypothetical protein
MSATDNESAEGLNPLQQLIQDSISHARDLNRIPLSISMDQGYQVIYNWFTQHRHLCDYLTRAEYAAYARKLIDLMPKDPTVADMKYIFTEVSSYGLEWAFPIIAGKWPLGKIARSALEGVDFNHGKHYAELEESQVWQTMRASAEWQAARGGR